MKKELLKFTDWFEKTIPDKKFNFSEIVSKRIEGTQCGSVCCAMGWLPRYDSRVKWYENDANELFLTMEECVLPFDWINDDDSVPYNIIASKLFNMDSGDAYKLFNPNDQWLISGWGDYPVCGHDATVKDVADAIRHYVDIKS